MAGRPLRSTERAFLQALKEVADESYVQVGVLNMSLRGAVGKIEAGEQSIVGYGVTSEEKRQLLQHLKEAIRATARAHEALDEIGALVYRLR
jgi:hypothetical protein